MQENHVQPLGWEDPLEKGLATTPVFLGTEFHEQTIFLAGYNPWGHKESDRTELLTLKKAFSSVQFSLSVVSNSLQPH